MIAEQPQEDNDEADATLHDLTDSQEDLVAGPVSTTRYARSRQMRLQGDNIAPQEEKEDPETAANVAQVREEPAAGLDMAADDGTADTATIPAAGKVRRVPAAISPSKPAATAARSAATAANGTAAAPAGTSTPPRTGSAATHAEHAYACKQMKSWLSTQVMWLQLQDGCQMQLKADAMFDIEIGKPVKDGGALRIGGRKVIMFLCPDGPDGARVPMGLPAVLKSSLVLTQDFHGSLVHVMPLIDGRLCKRGTPVQDAQILTPIDAQSGQQGPSISRSNLAAPAPLPATHQEPAHADALKRADQRCVRLCCHAER